MGAGTGSSACYGGSPASAIGDVVKTAARQVRTPLTTRGVGLHGDPQLLPVPDANFVGHHLPGRAARRWRICPPTRPLAIDETKIARVGRMISLATMVLASDTAF